MVDFSLLWLITRDLSWKPSVSVAIWLIFILHLGFRNQLWVGNAKQKSMKLPT
jgi:hypothetical protein